jgi:hypothetical protein
MAIWRRPFKFMNFLKSLFGTKKRQSSAMDVLEGIRMKMKQGNCPLFDALFFAVVGVSSRLSLSVGMASFSGSLSYRSRFDYDDEIASFEVAAFQMAKADVYLSARHRGFHDQIFAILESKFAETFSAAAEQSPRKCRELLNDRLEHYCRLLHSGQDPNRVFAQVSANIHESLRKGRISASSELVVPPSSVSVDDIMMIRSLKSSDAAFSKQMIGALDKVVLLSRK